MTGRTEHYGLSTISNSGDGVLSDDGFKYTGEDRQLIDRLLANAASHHHIGGSNAIPTPTDPPELSLSTTGGSLQAGIRIYYKYTLVDVNGFESAASSEATIDTPAQVSNPGAPTLTTATTGGTLISGQYFYVLAAYSGGVSTQETRAGAAASIHVPSGTSTNTVTVTFPTLPSNATGWNIYAKQPGSTQYYYVTSVNMNTATPPTEYIDDGSPAVDCARVSPTVNTTLSQNSVTVTFPGATPIVPVGYTWRIYRTFVLGNYNSSLLHWVVEETTPGTVDATYLDDGIATSPGTPPTVSQSIDNPDPVDLTDGAEVQGRLPLGMVTAFPFVATFVAQGPLTSPQVGIIPWRCPFPSALVVRIEAQLTYSAGHATPNSFPVRAAGAIQCAVRAVRANLAWDASLASDIASSGLIVAAGQHHKELSYAQLSSGQALLNQGDHLLVDVGADTGATPTAQGCVITVSMLVQFTGLTSDETLWE